MTGAEHTEQKPPTSGGENEEAKPDFSLRLDWWDEGDTGRITIHHNGDAESMAHAFIHFLRTSKTSPLVIGAVGQYAELHGENSLSEQLFRFAEDLARNRNSII